MRKNFIDNLRSICILLLFPFHTCMIYNNWGELFYITDKPYNIPSQFVSIVYPWWMNLLFTIAGISSFYALKKRTRKEYAKERVEKLLIPFLIGLVMIIPIQSYIADIFYNNYSGGYFEHYKVFFTTFTDLTGQDGGFTPAHLWFVLYLYVISMLLLPMMSTYSKSTKKIDGSKVGLFHLIPLFIVILLCTPIIELGGKSVGESLACFAIGYFLLSNEEIQERLVKNRALLTVLFLVSIIVRIILKNNDFENGLIWDVEQRMMSWFGILAILSLGRSYLNGSNSITNYLSKAAFPLYYFHQSVLVVLGYFVVKYIDSFLLQFVIIMFGSFLLSILCYEVFRRSKVSSYLFGIKYLSK